MITQLCCITLFRLSQCIVYSLPNDTAWKKWSLGGPWVMSFFFFLSQIKRCHEYASVIQISFPWYTCSISQWIHCTMVWGSKEAFTMCWPDVNWTMLWDSPALKLWAQWISVHDGFPYTKNHQRTDQKDAYVTWLSSLKITIPSPS